MKEFVVLIRVHAALVALEQEDALTGIRARAISAPTTADAIQLAHSGTVDLALIEYRDDDDTPLLTEALKQNTVAHFAFDNRVFREDDTINGALRVFPYPFPTDAVVAAIASFQEVV